MILPSGKSGTLSSSARISNDLIAHIDFSNDYGWSGNTANDLANRSVQYSTPGGYLSVVSGSTAEPGYIDLDGSTDYLFAGKTLAEFYTVTALTVDAWVKLDTYSLGTIVSNNTSAVNAANRGFAVISFPDGSGNWVPRINLNNGTLSSTFSFTGLTASTEQWVNLFVTFQVDGPTYVTGKIFKPNGISASNFSLNGIANTGLTSNNRLAFGRRSVAAIQYWNGAIGAVKVYNRVLSETEMNLNYERSKKRYGHS
jgi:hypothetical protein